MMNPIKQALACLFLFMWLSPVLAADLKMYSDVYQKNSEEIRQTFQPKFDDLQIAISEVAGGTESVRGQTGRPDRGYLVIGHG